MEIFIVLKCATIGPFLMYFMFLTIRSTTINFWVVTILKLVLTPSFITVDMFDVFLP